MTAHWVIGIVMAAGLHAQPQACNVDVYVMAGVPVPANMLGVAERKATQMFREIGVTLRMRDGIPRRGPSGACGAPIVVQLEDSAGYQGHGQALAFAEPYKAYGTCIHVFLDRVVRLNLNPEPGFANTLMAHVLVHEITHVLERSKRHSEEGVMKALWSARDYQRMGRHPLTFAPEDVQIIREGLIERAETLQLSVKRE